MLFVVVVVLQRNKQKKSSPEAASQGGCGEGGGAGASEAMWGPGGRWPGALGQADTESMVQAPRKPLCLCSPDTITTMNRKGRMEKQMGMFPRSGEAGRVTLAAWYGTPLPPTPARCPGAAESRHGQTAWAGVQLRKGPASPNGPWPGGRGGDAGHRGTFQGPEVAAAGPLGPAPPAAQGRAEVSPESKGQSRASPHCRTLPVGHPPRQL